MEEGRSLTRAQFEEVLRRATELALTEEEGDGEGNRISESELLRIAGEVGLPETHVRRALAEVGNRPTAPETWQDRWFGSAYVSASRVVPGTPDALLTLMDGFLVGGQLLQPLRRGRDFASYRPAVDWLSRFAQAAASTSRHYYWAYAQEVEVRVHPVDPQRCLVELRVDPGARQGAVGGSIGGGAAGAGGMVGLGIALSVTGVLPVVAAVAVGLVGAGGVGALSAHLGRSHMVKRHGEVKQELEGVLDRLEMGEGLEPPPASWRRWVQRQAKLLRVDLQGSMDLKGGNRDRG
jgi:hypothetical protein